MENINKNNEDVIETLNDLVQINNDRIVGYEKALEDTKGDSHYNTLFNQMISQVGGTSKSLYNRCAPSVVMRIGMKLRIAEKFTECGWI
jgi:hypothetical protein